MWPNPQTLADLVTNTGKILNGKLHFLCSASWNWKVNDSSQVFTGNLPFPSPQCCSEVFSLWMSSCTAWKVSDTLYLSVFSPNAGKHGPEITPYLDTFHAVTLPMVLDIRFSFFRYGRCYFILQLHIDK